jgi:NTE family protein
MDITLALGGGGVRGLAHLGVLKTLENHDFKIRAIAGTSAGGLVGAVYAAGISTEKIVESFKAMNKNRSFGRKDNDAPSLLGLSSITNALTELLGDCTFDDLKIPFAATAVSLRTGKEIILRKGKVLDAVLATIAIPGVFPSQEVGGRVLVDGGIMDPVPVQVARLMAPGLPVVAVLLHKPPDDFELKDFSLPLPIPGPSSIVERLTQLRPVQAFKVFSRSMEVASKHLTELSINLYEPEVVIAPPIGHIGLLDDVDVDKLINIGATATEATLQDIKSESNWIRRIKRHVKQQIKPPDFPDFWAEIDD